MERVATPDRTEFHPVAACGACGMSLVDVVATTHDERQVFDIPAIRIEVTAHRAEVKTCPGCGTENRGVFPVGVSGPVHSQVARRASFPPIEIVTRSLTP